MSVHHLQYPAVSRFQFPLWLNSIVPFAVALLGLGGIYSAVVLAFATAPSTVNVGYMPKQPVPFSHKLHAGQLKMDCRYCHNTVDEAAHAAVPPTATCVNCHSASNPDGSISLSAIHTKSPKLLEVRNSQATGDPIEWERIHDLPDYAHFNHSVHVNRGVGCATCHGRVDQMEEVYQAKTLSMSWCLDCHRNPEKFVRPFDRITDMEWSTDNQLQLGRDVCAQHGINPPVNCSTCHR